MGDVSGATKALPGPRDETQNCEGQLRAATTTQFGGVLHSPTLKLHRPLVK
jgi:hypothetical protein